MRGIFLTLCLLPGLAFSAGSSRVATIRTGTVGFDTSLTLTSFNVPSDISRGYLVVCIAGGLGTDMASGVSWNSRALTSPASVTNSDPTAGDSSAQFWVLSKPNTNVTSNLVISGLSSSAVYIATAWVIEGVSGISPEATGTQISTSATLTGSVTTVSATAFLVDCLSSVNADSNPATTQAGQIERAQTADGFALMTSAVSDKQGGGSPGSSSLGWNGLNSVGSPLGSNSQVLLSFSIAADATTGMKDLIHPSVNPGPR